MLNAALHFVPAMISYSVQTATNQADMFSGTDVESDEMYATLPSQTCCGSRKGGNGGTEEKEETEDRESGRRMWQGVRGGTPDHCRGVTEKGQSRKGTCLRGKGKEGSVEGREKLRKGKEKERDLFSAGMLCAEGLFVEILQGPLRGKHRISRESRIPGNPRCD